MRLWLLEEVKAIKEGLKGLIRVLVERADIEKDILLPGYTHLQVRYFRLPIISPDLDCSVNSALNQFGGHTYYYPMHSRSTPILNDLSSSSLVFQCYR
jgi:hypothetical protein